MENSKFDNFYVRLFKDDLIEEDSICQKLSIINQLAMASFKNIHIITNTEGKIIDVPIKIYECNEDEYMISFEINCDEIDGRFDYITGFTLFKLHDAYRLSLFERYIIPEVIEKDKTITVELRTPKKLLDVLIEIRQ